MKLPRVDEDETSAALGRLVQLSLQFIRKHIWNGHRRSCFPLRIPLQQAAAAARQVQSFQTEYYQSAGYVCSKAQGMGRWAGALRQRHRFGKPFYRRAVTGSRSHSTGLVEPTFNFFPILIAILITYLIGRKAIGMVQISFAELSRATSRGPLQSSTSWLVIKRLALSIASTSSRQINGSNPMKCPSSSTV